MNSLFQRIRDNEKDIGIRRLIALSILMFLAVLTFSSSAKASLTCEDPSPANVALAIGTLALPTSVSVGETLKTLASQKFTIKCYYFDFVNSNSSNYAHFRSNSLTANGNDDIFLTNLPGIGVRFF